uniref:Uncharacterized protein n=1 Tax=Arundo donax TaxID=35708 RepID=A0A0A9A6G1_ARUDO
MANADAATSAARRRRSFAEMYACRSRSSRARSARDEPGAARTSSNRARADFPRCRCRCRPPLATAAAASASNRSSTSRWPRDAISWSSIPLHTSPPSLTVAMSDRSCTRKRVT